MTAGTVGRIATWVVGFLTILVQRLAFHLGDDFIQLTTILLAAFFIIVACVPSTRFSLAGVALFCMLAVCGALSFFVSITNHLTLRYWSVFSLLLLLATYLGALFLSRRFGELAPQAPPLGRMMFSGMVWAITLAAILGIVQTILQASGLGFWDPISLLSPDLLASGFNSQYSLQYQGGVAGEFKPNGVFLLEPSFLSLYAAIALVYVLTRTFARPEGNVLVNLAWMGVLGTALVQSRSTSGLVVLGLAAPFLIFRIRRNIWAFVVVIVALAVLWTAGAFDALSAKATEGINQNSSTALRLIIPYEAFPQYWLAHPWFGSGSGVASGISTSAGVPGLQMPTILKALIEYGVIGAAVVLSIVGLALRRSAAPMALLVGVFAAWLIPSEALVNPTLVAMLVFALPHWTRPAGSSTLPEDRPEPVHARGRTIERVSVSELTAPRSLELAGVPARSGRHRRDP